MRTNSNSGEVTVSSVGMVSSVGLDAANCCAAARAGITRAAALTFSNFSGDQLWGKEAVVGHAVAAAEGFTGLGKVLTLGALALQDLIQRAGIFKGKCDRTGLYINLSDKYFEEAYARESGNGQNPLVTWRQQTADVTRRLAELCKLTIRPENQAVVYGGHAGMVQLVMQAARQMQSGHLDRCIVGGIDTYLELPSLVATASLGVLKTKVNDTGFIPGEAAAFLLLEKRESISRDDRRAIATIEGAAVAEEKCDRLSGRPSHGIALFQAIRDCVCSCSGEDHQSSHFIGDLNGDSFRGTEWGYVLVRMAQLTRAQGAPLWIPAQSFGETGAAAGALACCMAIRGLERRYLRAENAVVWLSSENGAKGALRFRSYREQMN